MAAKKRYVWAIYFVGFDDSGQTAECHVEPYVGKERICTTEDPRKAWDDVEVAVFSRGGQLLTIVSDDEQHAEAIRRDNEHQILRRR